MANTVYARSYALFVLILNLPIIFIISLFVLPAFFVAPAALGKLFLPMILVFFTGNAYFLLRFLPSTSKVIVTPDTLTVYYLWRDARTVRWQDVRSVEFRSSRGIWLSTFRYRINLKDGYLDIDSLAWYKGISRASELVKDIISRARLKETPVPKENIKQLYLGTGSLIKKWER